MKTLIVENQWELEEDMVTLLAQEPELFAGVTKHLHAIQLPEETNKLIAQHDALLICTYFFHKRQLERLVSAFYAKAFGDKVYKVYARGLLGFMDTWTTPGRPNKTFFTIVDGVRVADPDDEYDYTARSGFTSEETHKRFLREITSMVNRGKLELYCWDHDYCLYDTRTGKKAERGTPLEFIEDDDREWVIRRICYDKKLKRFHYEGKEPEERD